MSAARTPYPAELLAANLDFHAGIAAIADNPEAEEMSPRGWRMRSASVMRQRIRADIAR